MKNVNRSFIVFFFLVIFIGSLGFFNLLTIKQIGYQVIYGYRDEDANNLSFLNKISYVKDNIEEIIDKNVGMRENYIEINGLINRLLGVDVVIDAGRVVYKLKDGNLALKYSEADTESIRHNADELIKFNEYLKEKNIPMIYMSVPNKIDAENPKLPIGNYDYSNLTTDIFLSFLDENDVNYMDIRSLIKDDSIDYSSIFFKTDHHWKIESALWATGKLLEKMSVDYGHTYNKELINIENYNSQLYEKWFLGSIGKRVGRLYGGVDDINIITPNFNTNFEYTINNNTPIIGSFSESLLFYDHINNKDYYNKNPYATYLNGDFAKTLIKNNLNVDGGKVLLIRDSSACPLAAFLALCVGEITTIDLRYNQETNVINYINEYNPDYVIFSYTSGRIKVNDAFNFGI